MPRWIINAIVWIIESINLILNKLSYIYEKFRELFFSFMYPAPALFSHKQKSFKTKHNTILERINHQNLEKDYKLIHLAFNRVFGPRVLSTNSDIDVNYTPAQDLDALMITNNNKEIFALRTQYIIMINDYNSCYEEHVDEMIGIAEKIISKNNQCNFAVIGFNPVGVGMSQGAIKCPEHYQNAIEHIIDGLMHNEHVPAHHIILLGQGFGGSLATIVANEYHKQRKEIKVINDRAFAKLDDFAGLRAQNIIPTSFLRSTVGKMGFYIAKYMAKFFSLDLDASTAFNEIFPGYAIVLQREDETSKSDPYNLANHVKTFRNIRIKNFHDNDSKMDIIESFLEHYEEKRDVKKESIHNQQTQAQATNKQIPEQTEGMFFKYSGTDADASATQSDSGITYTRKPSTP